MERLFPPRRHASIAEIINKAKNGDSFFVNRAAINGDLSLLSEKTQRLIVAIANDQTAALTYNQIIPLTEDKYNLQMEFIEKHLNLAFNVFVKGDGKSMTEEISDFYNNIPLASSK